MIPPLPKRCRLVINDNLRRQICKWSDTNKNKKYHEVAVYFNEKYPDLEFDQSIILKILKEKDR